MNITSEVNLVVGRSRRRSGVGVRALQLPDLAAPYTVASIYHISFAGGCEFVLPHQAVAAIQAEWLPASSPAHFFKDCVAR